MTILPTVVKQWELVLWLGFESSFPNPYSANYVMPGCRDYVSLTTFKQGWCGGLITGLAQMHSRCMPPQLTQRQLASAIVQYIDARPARMHEDFRILAAEAMRAAWPCKGHKYRGRPRSKAASDVGVTEHQQLQGEPRRQRQAR
jgi:hypothetical protein